MTDDSRIRELVQRAAADSDFAGKLINDPASVSSEYGLSAAQVGRIKELADQGMFKPSVEAHSAAPADYY